LLEVVLWVTLYIRGFVESINRNHNNRSSINIWGGEKYYGRLRPFESGDGIRAPT
jgi:hypothetical protein